MKHGYILFIWVFLTNHTLLGQGLQYNYASVLPKSFDVNIRYKKINGKLFINASINGRKVKLLVDSGAPNTISPEVAKALSLRDFGNTQISDVNGVNTTAAIVLVNSLEINGIIFRNLPTVVTKTDKLSCYGADGIIGSNILSKSIITIDDTEAKISITNQSGSHLLKNSNRSELKLTTGASKMPIISVKIGNVSQDVVFDLGFSGMLAIRPVDFEKLKSAGVFSAIEEGYGSAFGSNSGQANASTIHRVSISGIEVNGARFMNIVSSTFLFSYSILGAELIKYGIVMVDYINHKFYFRPRENVNILDNRVWPLTVGFGPEKVQIMAIWKKTGPKELQPGSEIIKINERELKSESACIFEIRQSPLKEPNLEKARILFKDRDGRLLEYLVLREKL